MNEADFAHYYQHHRAALEAYALTLTRNDFQLAEEMVDDAFVRLKSWQAEHLSHALLRKKIHWLVADWYRVKKHNITLVSIDQEPESALEYNTWYALFTSRPLEDLIVDLEAIREHLAAESTAA